MSSSGSLPGNVVQRGIVRYYPDDEERPNAAQVMLTAQRKTGKIDNEKQQIKKQQQLQVKPGENQQRRRLELPDRSLHAPRLNPLIHLAMSPTAAPNNTPVEESDSQYGAFSPLPGHSPENSGSKPQTEVLPPHPRPHLGTTTTAQEKEVFSAKIGEEADKNDAGHVGSDSSRGEHASVNTPAVSINSGDALPSTRDRADRLYQSLQTPVYLFPNDGSRGGHVSETDTLHDSRKSDRLKDGIEGNHGVRNASVIRRGSHSLGRNNSGQHSGHLRTASHGAIVSGITAPSSSPCLGMTADYRNRDLHGTESAMTPKRLHFDCSTEKIDPGAGISSISAQKINITSLLNSRSTAESISPPPSTAENEYAIHFPSSAASNPHSTGSYLQPKYQNHHPQVSSTMNRIVSPNYMFEADHGPGPFGNISSSSNSRGSNTGSSANSNTNNANITYQPKYFNTKFDELRNRVLLGSSQAFPEAESANKYPYNSNGGNPTSNDQDANVDAEAAAIISQMRSSPLPPFNEQFGTGSRNSRPNSSLSSQSIQNNAFHSFSKRVLPTPVLRVNQRPFSGNQDEQVIMEEDDDGEDYGDGEFENEDSEPKAPETVAWNKNGKRRLSRRRSGPPHYQSQLKGLKISDVDNQENSYYPSTDVSENSIQVKRSRSSSLSTETSALLSPDSKNAKQLKFKESNFNNDVSNEQMVKSSDQIKKRNATGARSRTGCWICRLRKKKCTEEKPQCQNCVRLHLECFYDIVKPDFISDPTKKAAKLDEIKKKTKEAKRQAMKKKTWL